MPVTATADGYTLWYEVTGDGPALVFPARLRNEFAALGSALAARYRVVRYKPRQVIGVMEPEDEAGGQWEPAGLGRYPDDLEVADLHAVADAAGVEDFFWLDTRVWRRWPRSWRR